MLSATAPTQVVLLERTRTGSVGIVAPPFDLPDPVLSDDGIAETGATVLLTTPSGETLVAQEDLLFRESGGGIYRFALRGDALARGATYRLTVQTTKGEVLTAETSVPEGAAAADPDTRAFDRSRDTLTLEWPATPGARSYFVRIETPFGPRMFFSEDTRLRLTGDLRNADVDELPRVFIPGFPQAVTVSAVDSNYYDWFRTHNNVFSGVGVISRVTGGIGVFGSLVRLRFADLTVVAPQGEPGTGHYNLIGTPTEQAGSPYNGFELYLESRASRSDQGDALSGRCEKKLRFGESDPIRGVLGTSRNGQVELAMLRRWSAADTVDTFTGEIRGDTIVGRFPGAGGTVRFVKDR